MRGISGVRAIWRTKMVIDSASSPDPAGAPRTRRITRWWAAASMLGDLSWTHSDSLARDVVAGVREPAKRWRKLPKVTQDRRGMGRHPCATFRRSTLAAWIRRLAGRGGSESLNCSVARTADEDDTLAACNSQANGMTVKLAREKDRMVVTLNGASQCTNLPQPTDYHADARGIGNCTPRSGFRADIDLRRPIGDMVIQREMSMSLKSVRDAAGGSRMLAPSTSSAGSTPLSRLSG
jgi:hypothetical protein